EDSPVADPVFHLVLSIELKAERSTFPDAAASVGAGVLAGAAGSLQEQKIPSPTSTCATSLSTEATRPVTASPTLCSATNSSRLVGISCFMLSRSWRFSL